MAKRPKTTTESDAAAQSERFKLIGDHPEDLASGQVLAPGESTELTAEQQDDPHNKRLIEDGVLISGGSVPAPTVPELEAPDPPNESLGDLTAPPSGDGTNENGGDS